MFGNGLTILNGLSLFGGIGCEDRTAVGTESFSGGIFTAASFTFKRKGRPAVAAKAFSIRDVRPAPRAKHAILLPDSR